MADVDVIQTVMNKIEDFYFGDGEQCGEYIFNEFAKKHHHLFEAECDAE